MGLNKKIFKVIFVVIILLNLCILKVNAIDSIIQGADDFLNTEQSDLLNKESVKKVSDRLFSVFMAVGVALILTVGVILGIQFMMGSIEEKVKVKEALIPYVIGAIVIFGAFGIWSVVYEALSGTF